jgi:hypothetical protein
MTRVAIALLRGMSWMCWWVADAIEPKPDPAAEWAAAVAASVNELGEQ